MRFHHVIVAALAVCALPSTQAFTQGHLLLPSYLCGPAVANADGTIAGTDGKPKALGGVLAGLMEYTYANSKEVDPMNNDFLYDPVVDPMIFLGAMHNAHATHVTNQFHGGDRRPLPPGGLDNVTTLVINNTPVPGNIYTGKGDAQLGPLKPYNNVTVPIKAQTNVLAVVGIPAIPPPVPVPGEDPIPGAQVPSPTNFTVIRPNQLVILSLGALNDIQGRTGAANFFDPANGADNALDGAIIYAQDAKNVRIGKFVADADGVAVPWDACVPAASAVAAAIGALTPATDVNGLVHAQLLSGTNVFNGAQFFVPFNFAWTKSAHPGPAVTNFTMMGAAVSDGGFGFHQTKWQVQPYTPFVANVANLNKADREKCVPMQTKPTMAQVACGASCIDCITQAGSTQNKQVFQANGFAFTCAPNMNIGNGKTTATVYSTTCMVKNKIVTTVPVGTQLIQTTLKPADAAGLSAEDQAYIDAMTQAFDAAGAGTDPAQTQTTCPTSNTVNTANAQAQTSWFTTIITVAASVIAAARR